MAMRKTDKKIDKQIVQALTKVCHQALEDIEGFVWLTHQVNFAQFPQSLQVICVFETDQQLASFVAKQQTIALQQMIIYHLERVGISILSDAISFDTEQRCTKEHGGNWAKRLQ